MVTLSGMGGVEEDPRVRLSRRGIPWRHLDSILLVSYIRLANME
jgi:hypothetical protein